MPLIPDASLADLPVSRYQVDELQTSGRAELQALKTTTDSSRRVSALASGNIFPHALQSTSSSAGIAAAVSAAAAEHAAQHGMEGVDVQLFKVRTELAAVQQELEARTTQFELQLQVRQPAKQSNISTTRPAASGSLVHSLSPLCVR